MLDFNKAMKFMVKVDPILASIMPQILADSARPLHNPTKIKPSEYAFHLYSSIISQQISTKAADAILKRFLELVGDPHDAANILRHDIEDYRNIGLSRQKAGYIKSIAELTSNGTVRIEHLDELSDQEVINELVKIKGVGLWTAEMFLMFTLARPDVFSVGDLGLLNAARVAYGKPNLTREELALLSQKWSPYRTTAALVLWHSLDNKPKS